MISITVIFRLVRTSLAHKIYRSLKRQLEESQERERNLRMRLARYEAAEP
jgi:hypothetical protein